ncbi:MAG: hypothetical protein R2854_07270 [Caldilineaceae bacterium]
MTADDLAVVTIKGLPGSGKTVALLYLLRDLIDMPGDGRILHVTYTAAAQARREFVESQYTGGGPDPAGAHPYRHAGRSAPRLDGHLQPGSSSSAKWT